MKIAIDGPAGAGKSTIAKFLARELGFIYVDTGAMYRALTWKALREDIDLSDAGRLEQLTRNTRIAFQYNTLQQVVLCDDIDVTIAIRTPAVNVAVSIVASYSAIRSLMVKQQQQMACHHSVVMDGRDIGECVLPDADLKFFLTASLEERARRRQLELAESGFDVAYETIRQDIIARDRNDAEREVGALKVLPDSIVIDTSFMNIEQLLQLMLDIIGRAGHAL